MFEKEAEEYGLQQALWCTSESGDLRDAFKDGAELGYNKAKNEWHYVQDGDLPTEDLRPRTLGYYLTATKYNGFKRFFFEVAYFTGDIFIKDGAILDNVIAWKEIVLPKEIENE